MSEIYTSIRFATVICLSICLTACGATSSDNNSTSASTDTDFSFDTVQPQINPNTSGGVTPSPSPTPNVVTNKDPVIEYSIEKLGYDGDITFTVPARLLLKVKFRPEPSFTTVTGTGFVPRYSSLLVYIKVGTYERATPLLSNGLFADQGGIAQESFTIDFSNKFTKTCAATNTACRQMVTITIRKPNYDYWYLNYGIPGCMPPILGSPPSCQPYSRVEATHTWNGSLFIQTDDTNSL